jgi:hypothetical protein
MCAQESWANILWKRRNTIFSGNFVVVTVEKRQKNGTVRVVEKKQEYFSILLLFPLIDMVYGQRW